MLVYGRNVAKELLENGKIVQKIILQDGFSDKEINSLIEKRKVPVQYKSKREIDRLAPGVHQGIILFIPDYKYKDISDVLDDEAKFFVILDHLEDPHNLGAIIRTCEAAKVDALIMPKDRQAQVNSTVMKTSAGTLDNVSIVTVTNLVSTIDELKKNGFWIVGTALEDSVDYRSIDYSGKIALVIGNEGSGMSKLVKNACDFIAKIPMYGTTNSLNASVASGIMIYEVIRNRK
ncbi:MAG: 23S rRNA (guanosine(2251)-2'-O)-methyltransferase RlmB [Bacilli bacterium]|nr:23S rRNA (guanosine(2251)-2'-O)-methyltransferase RlmB [Mycoplasmatota bacterium]MDD6941158.1 23S rRNA (guanosine(2251)-2'-O)-methyltransferase RlmB [bacterium]MDY2697179.1 23S rRNA (guanosine(2251)-2'-O)-methyltransferase RlmB [Bacilli bacterium]MDY5992943.1 23S rRNA (guanosine(2251)-2'-O)-methyltransferase RlmB [Bacilli bacterium]MEE0014653.1 23S rRNA (guanosine(2251)-2'-O)-methyltransferase RlmB [Bacilli bacterium]